MSSEMTFAWLSRRDYDRAYDLLADSNAELLRRLSEHMAEAATARGVNELRAWKERLVDDVGGDLGVGAIHDGVVFRHVDGVDVCVDIVEPRGPGPHPILLYFHGGGWVMGSSRDYRQLAWRFAEAGYLVFNVDYRLAPEFPFPAAYEDCVAAVRWVGDVAAQYGGDVGRLTVGGDSAGSNLAAAVAAHLFDDPGAPRVRAALLIYGVYDMAIMAGNFMCEAYLGPKPDESLLQDPRVSPLFAAEKLPPSFVVVGSSDQLLGQAADLARALELAGIAHEHVVVPNMPHAFVNREVYPEARATIDRMASFLDAQLAAPARTSSDAG